MESIDPATATCLPGLTFLFVRILLCGPDALHLSQVGVAWQAVVYPSMPRGPKK